MSDFLSLRLPPEALRRVCDPAQFDFSTAAELPDPDGIVGQQRAVDAIRFGIEIAHGGYNLFVLGPAGAGKHTVLDQFLSARAKAEPAPDGWCCVHDFAHPHKPHALRLPPGRACRLQRDMAQLVDELRAVIPATFESDAAAQNVALIRTPLGFSLAPQPVPLDVKVILFGDRWLHYLLHEPDPDFCELFKVSADFEEDLPRERGGVVSLADTPVRQSLAVTGSIDQHGDVQAIGDVNEKIEGFFDLCRARGLTGEQGVVIPRANVKHLDVARGCRRRGRRRCAGRFPARQRQRAGLREARVVRRRAAHVRAVAVGRRAVPVAAGGRRTRADRRDEGEAQ
ncbi:AAA family ATPase [Burkholderia humptydooensis]|uniref:AAA family ATPase n=2 Tax=Burkholderia humptydooensis TaxID=430531 RepID=A0A7U4P985_9BURK|nr:MULTISPECIES: AAA family ATPase [Burkholderia]AJY39570.1 AAA domain protein [Burkholderia sp. 2002721687]ALX45319.1 peptidase [Burkholderia humptydooensis]EIP85495.1 putative ATP-dependent protease [Burkholderia humptydooensis MSMB43]QPS46787.1 AAA family ATPase [Burkholderia humptydooensis]